MTDISPAARATYDAFNRVGLYNEPSFETDRKAIAAALRAAADQCKIDWNYHPDYPETESVVVVSDLLAIAAELEQLDG